MADGQRRRGPGSRRVSPRHVWHRGLLAHLGKERLGAPNLYLNDKSGD